MAHGPPFVLQDREVQLVAPALEPLVFDEAPLLPHAEASRETRRALIVGINPGHETVKAEIVEGKMQEPVPGLDGVPLAREGRIEDLADLSAAMLG